MEFKEVIGRRRSIRFFDPDRPVEREKIQKMLEAARLASCAVNAQWARAVVAFRKDLTDDQFSRLKTPVAALNVDLAPVHIHWFNDLSVVKKIKGSRLKELVDVGALAPTHGWSHKFVDEFVYPQILEPMTEGPGYPIASTFDVGGAMTQALLTGVDEGLGVCLVTLNGAVLKEVFKVPEEWIPLSTILVGYPAESWDGGGQRPRPPFEELYHEGAYGTPFRRDAAVTEELKVAKMIQEPAKPHDPKRIAEIRRLAEQYGLPM
ncbi:MAG: nitroreductase family protein [Dehalococcoidia bacterium]